MSGSVLQPRLRPLPPCDGAVPVPERTLKVFFDGAWHEIPFYRRAELRANHRFAGPCVVVQDDSTACVPPGFSAAVDASGNILLERAE